MNAARIGDLQRTLELLKNDAHVEVMDSEGRTALHWACIGVNGRYNAEHPAVLEALLHPPGRSENLKLVRRNRPAGSALIDGVDIIDKYDDDGYTALGHACFYGNPDLVRVLLDNGVNIERESYYLKGNTPLMVVCGKRQEGVTPPAFIETVRLLLMRGANKEVRLGNGYTPLIKACSYNNVEIANILIEAGANIDATTRALSYTCMHIAAYTNNINIIRLLASKGMDVNIQTQPPPGQPIDPSYTFGDTALHMVCTQGITSVNLSDSIETARVLLELGADLNVPNEMGRTPLDLACRYKTHPEVIRMLIANGANVEALNSVGQTPFDIITEVQEYGDPWIREVRQIFREAGVAIPHEEGLNGPRGGGGRRRTKRTRKMRRRR
jgi:ankyrin repeat protein